jgi:monoamine oxidase
MGKVIRLTLRFRERFWDSIKPAGARKSLSGMSFLFSQDDWFPTWWTASPANWPIITGWATFRSAQRLSGKGRSFVMEKGLQTLSSLLRINQAELEGLVEEAHCHDWQTDPFSFGDYSYGKVGANSANESLAESVDNTLYFAGEATDTTGNNGTVHGAIASGYRAAQQILKATK